MTIEHAQQTASLPSVVVEEFEQGVVKPNAIRQAFSIEPFVGRKVFGRLQCRHLTP
jgi:hypothetical protein